MARSGTRNNPGSGVIVVSVNLAAITHPAEIRKRRHPDAVMMQVGNSGERAWCLPCKNYGAGGGSISKGKSK